MLPALGGSSPLMGLHRSWFPETSALVGVGDEGQRVLLWLCPFFCGTA